MALIDDVIKELPEAVREMVRAHMAAVIKMEIKEQQEWINLLLMRHYNRAYEFLNERLSPGERLKEQERLNRMMVEMNTENKAASDMWRDFFASLIAILLQRLTDEIIGEI